MMIKSINVGDVHFGMAGFDLDAHFHLSPSFLSRYRELKPAFGFNGLGEFVFYRTYSRSKEDGSKETFFDTLVRVIEGTYEIQRRHCSRLHVPWDYGKAQASAQEMFGLMWDFKFLPPGRGLWTMGTKFMWERGSASANNCLEFSTEVITCDGIKPIGEMVGTVQTLLTEGNKWVDVPIKSFGRQKLWKLTLSRSDVEKVIFATAHHRWLARCNADAPYESVDTCELSPHHSLQSITANEISWSVKSIEQTERVEEVFCPQVPETNNFALADNILTGNCGFCSTIDIGEDPSEPLCFLMDMSMLGVGIGFDTRGANKLEIHKPSGGLRTHLIHDSREGWVNAVRDLVRSYTTHAGSGIPDFDPSNIRPAGADIKGFGGKASGPVILMELLGLLRKLFDSRIYKRFSSVDIVDAMNYIGRCVVAGNVRRCKPYYSLVQLDRGIVQIKDVLVGDKVLTADGYQEVSEVVYQGPQEIIEIHHQMGVFECTAKHRMAVLVNQHEYVWKQAENLLPGDRLVFIPQISPGIMTNLPANRYIRSKYCHTGIDIVIPELDTDVSWFLGALHGDGYVFTNKRVNGYNASVMFPINRDEYHDGIVNKLNVAFAKFGVHANPMPSKDNSSRHRVINKQFSWYLYENFKQPKTPIDIPECIMSGTPDVRAAYLAGLFDTDGSIKSNHSRIEAVCSIYRRFVDQVQALYASLGIPVRLRKYTPKPRKNGKVWNTKFKLHVVGRYARIKFHNLITKYSVKKTDLPTTTYTGNPTVNYSYTVARGNIQSCSQYPKSLATIDWCESAGSDVKRIPVAVKHIERPGRIVETYDLSVCGRHELVADCLLTHNTAEIVFGRHDDDAYVNMKNPTHTLLPEDMKLWNHMVGLVYSRCADADTETANYHMNVFEFYEDSILLKAGANCSPLNTIPMERLAPAVETFNAMNNHRWASNNSIFAEVGMDYKEVARSAGVNGEPGLLWLDSVRNYGRMIDGRKEGVDRRVMGANPCFSGDMRLLTVDGYKTMHQAWLDGGCFEYGDTSTMTVAGRATLMTHSTDLQRTINCTNVFERYGSQTIVNRTGQVRATNVYRTSLDADLYRVAFSDGSHIDATDRHIFIILVKSHTGHTTEVRKPLSDLTVGDIVPNYPESHSTITSIEYVGRGETFCLTEPNDHRVVVNGHEVGQCNEQSLESMELCCLVESFPTHHESAEEYHRTLKFCYLYAKTVTLMPTHHARTNSVMQRNRRIGLSQSGIVQAFAKFGRRAVLRDFCDRGYAVIDKWDQVYSDWLCCTKSIKRTSVKPSGTVSLLVGATPGIHYPEATSYWRRVRVSKKSPLIAIYKAAGYHIEPDYKDADRTSIIKFAIADDRVRPQSEVSLYEQMENAADYQHYWADNQVSCTIKFKPHEKKELQNVLEIFEERLKGISFLPLDDHNYPQAPYERCTREEVDAYNAKLLPVDMSSYLYEEATGVQFCDGDSCTM